MGAKYEDLRSSMEQHVIFANNEMARLKADVAKMTQKWKVNMAKAEQLSLQVLCGICGQSQEVP